VSRLAWTALILVISAAIADAALAPTPAPEHPDFIDTVLASRAVVIALRIAVVFAALFVVLSVVALIARRQWLTRIGPVEVSDLSAENQRLRQELAEAKRMVDHLRQKISISDRMLDENREV
jgi:hypothetical protein